jgi:hypothetical protein
LCRCMRDWGVSPVKLLLLCHVVPFLDYSWASQENQVTEPGFYWRVPGHWCVLGSLATGAVRMRYREQAQLAAVTVTVMDLTISSNVRV